MADQDVILDAAYGILVAQGWSAARMADVAALAGVSRQTLYNTYGSKEGLARAVLLREATRYLDSIAALLARHDDPGRAVTETVLFTLTEVGANPLLKAVLTASAGEDLLPLVTTRSDWLLAAARAAVADALRRRWSALAAEDVELLADVTVRLTVSHLLTPAGPAELIAQQLGRLVTRFMNGAVR